MRYRARLVADVAIEAENVVEARRLAKSLRVIPSRVGARRNPKDRDFIAYKVEVGETRVDLAKVP
jgi:hypothetical protein